MELAHPCTRPTGDLATRDRSKSLPAICRTPKTVLVPPTKTRTRKAFPNFVWEAFLVLVLNGRGGEIRTPDPHNPIVVRYQAALRPDLCTKV